MFHFAAPMRHLFICLAVQLLFSTAFSDRLPAQSEKIDDIQTWSEETWADKLIHCQDWRKIVSLGYQLQQLPGDKDARILAAHWDEIPTELKPSLLRSYFPAFHKKDRIDDQYFIIMDLGLNDKDADVVSRAKAYIDPLTVVPITMDQRSYERWKKTWKTRTASEIIRARAKEISEDMKSYGRFEARDGLAYLQSSASTLLHFHQFRNVWQKQGLPAIFERWSKKGWLDFDKENRDRIQSILATKTVALPEDFQKWTDQQWKQALTTPTDAQWREGWKLGVRLQQLQGDRDLKLLKENWADISNQVKPQIIKTYQPWFAKTNQELDEQYFDVLHLGRTDEHEKVNQFARGYLKAILLTSKLENDQHYEKWYNQHRGNSAKAIVVDQAKSIMQSMDKVGKEQAVEILQDLNEAAMVIRYCEPLNKTLVQSALKQKMDAWVKKGWLEEIGEEYTSIAKATWARPAALIRFRNEAFQVGDDKKKNTS